MLLEGRPACERSPEHVLERPEPRFEQLDGQAMRRTPQGEFTLRWNGES